MHFLIRSQEFSDILDVVDNVLRDQAKAEQQEEQLLSFDSQIKKKDKPRVDFNIIGKVHVNKITNPKQLNLIR